MVSLLSQTREQENFVDHTWIKGSVRRMIALAETATDKATAQGAIGILAPRTALIYVFQATDGAPYLEIKQTITVRTRCSALVSGSAMTPNTFPVLPFRWL
jgi:hypothetical protein